MLRTVSQKTGFYEYSAGSIKLSEPSMGEFVYGTCNRRRSKIPFFDVVRNTLPLPGVRLRHTKKDVHT